MYHRSKAIFVSLAKFAIPVAIIAWLLLRMEPSEWQQLREQPKDYLLLVTALFIAIAAMVLSFLRWWLLVRCQGIAITVVEACRLSAIGFLLSFVSPGSVGGDLFKAIFLAKRSPGKRFEAVASVVVDRGVGLLGLMLLVTIAFGYVEPKSNTAGEDITRIGRATMSLAVIGFGIVTVLILGGRPIDRLILSAATWPLVGALIQRVAGPLRMFHRHPVAFGIAVAMSVGVHLLLVVSIFLIACGLYSSPPNIADHFIVVPLAHVVSALPIAPAGIGVMEAAMEWLYRVIPATPTTASGTLVSLVYEVVKVVIAVIGMLFYWTAGRELKSSLEASSSEGGVLERIPSSA